MCRFPRVSEGASSRTRHLPRGRHRLPRDVIEQSQRDRLLTSAAEAVAENGYAATSVEDILKRAGVSRTTFYQLYDGKLDCFLAANRKAAAVVATALLDELAATEASGAAEPIEKLDRLLWVYLNTLAHNPALARVFLVEVYAAGPAAIEQRVESLEQFIDITTAIVGQIPGAFGGPAHQRLAAQTLVDAVSARVTTMVAIGDSRGLPDLHRPLMAFLRRIL